MTRQMARADKLESDARKSVSYLDGELKSVKSDAKKSVSYLDGEVKKVFPPPSPPRRVFLHH